MKFRIAGLLGAFVLLMLGSVPAVAQANISIGDTGALSNARQTATIQVALSCDMPSTKYDVSVQITQPSGRTLAEGVGSASGTCEVGERVTVGVDVTSYAAPFKPGPATVSVEVGRSWCNEDLSDCNFDFPDSTASATVKLQGNSSGTAPTVPQPANISIVDQGALSNGRQTATIQVAFSCDMPSTKYDASVRVAQPSGPALAEGVGSASGTCEVGERVTVGVDVMSYAAPFKPGPATVIVELGRSWCNEDFSDCNFDFPDSTASATVKFRGN